MGGLVSSYQTLCSQKTLCQIGSVYSSWSLKTMEDGGICTDVHNRACTKNSAICCEDWELLHKAACYNTTQEGVENMTNRAIESGICSSDSESCLAYCPKMSYLDVDGECKKCTRCSQVGGVDRLPCTSRSNAECETLSDLVAATASGETLLLKNKVYFGPGACGIVLKAKTLTMVAANPQRHVTIDCKGLNARHFSVLDGAQLTLDGVRLVNGKGGSLPTGAEDETAGADGDDGFGGGAVWVARGSKFTAINVGIYFADTKGSGGAVLAETGSTVTISGHSLIHGNLADMDGGCLFANAATLVIQGDSIIRNCSAAGNGGGVRWCFLSVSFTCFDLYECTFFVRVGSASFHSSLSARVSVNDRKGVCTYAR
jgi:hypothetical protein